MVAAAQHQAQHVGPVKMGTVGGECVVRIKLRPDFVCVRAGCSDVDVSVKAQHIGPVRTGTQRRGLCQGRTQWS
jgi:hypothetical protein